MRLASYECEADGHLWVLGQEACVGCGVLWSEIFGVLVTPSGRIIVAPRELY